MDENVENVQLRILEVVASGEEGAVCIVRCLSGMAYPGMTFSVSGGVGEGAACSFLRLEWIERYDFRTDILDAPHAAKVNLCGPMASQLNPDATVSSVARSG
ncbi:hypothetical protein GCM10010324_34300 [Streptomyces hiroshimensis]|uniref:Uncharacterized protein n=1 Tax=Streptomyces hiroshimensis TaxID=66424 RepID=A0ABQ2YLT9_9ACTN|nr:hypothetical protein GCM10010324_34300 [Streptomyces hiroshimensis]